MSYLQTVDPAVAEPGLAALYADDEGSLGYIANYTRTFSPRPEVYRAWRQLNGAIKGGMDQRRYEVATVAAARELRSSYCALAHGAVLARHHLPASGVRALITDADDPALDPVDRAVAGLAAKVAGGGFAITEADLAPLRELGVSDPEILDVVLAAAARCFFSTVLDATGTRPDAGCGAALDEVTRDTLTVGRPVDGAPD